MTSKQTFRKVQTFDYRICPSKKSNDIKQAESKSFGGMFRMFQTPHIVEASGNDPRTHSGVPLIVPVKLKPNAESIRNNDNVEAITMAIFDMDDGHDWEPFIKHWRDELKLTFVVHTSYSHMIEKGDKPAVPRWRAIFPMSKPVPVADWATVWRNLSDKLCHGVNDQACKDPARPYYIACCPEGMKEKFECIDHTGAFLNPNEYKGPVEPTRIEHLSESLSLPSLQHSNSSDSSSDQRSSLCADISPGSDFNNRTDFDQLIRDEGWTFIRESRGDRYYYRPGKNKEDHSAILHAGGQFYNFSSNAPIPAGRTYDAFGFYAYSKHGGDLSAAAKALSKQGYGSKKNLDSLRSDQRQRTENYAYVAASKDKDKDKDSIEFLPIGTNYFTDSVPWSLSDRGNGARIAQLCGDRLRFDSEQDTFVYWDGRMWVYGGKAESQARNFAYDSVDMFADMSPMATSENEAIAKAFKTFISNSNNTIKLNNALRECRSWIPTVRADFNTHPHLINCQNGVLNLKTFDLEPHNPEYCLSQITSCDFATTDELPEFFLETIEMALPDEETQSFLLDYLAFSITGYIPQKSFVLCWGPTANNGKSTIIDTVRDLLGDYATVVNDAAILDKFNATPDYHLAMLQDIRLGVVGEISNGRLNETIMKSLTGGENISARPIRQQPVNFKPIVKLIMHGNSQPGIKGHDEGIWSRVFQVPFEITIPEGKRLQPSVVQEKLKREAPAILRYLAKRAHTWISAGMPKIASSELMRTSTNEYREGSDMMALFYDTCCIPGGTTYYKSGEIVERYNEFARTQNSPLLNPQSFGLEFKSFIARHNQNTENEDHKIHKHTSATGKRTNGGQYKGFEFISDGVPRMEGRWEK